MTPLPVTVEVLCEGAADRSGTHARYLGRRAVVCAADGGEVRKVGHTRVVPSLGQLAAYDRRHRPWIIRESPKGRRLVRLGAPSDTFALGTFGESVTVEFTTRPIWIGGGTLAEKHTASVDATAPFVGYPLCETSDHYILSGSRTVDEGLLHVWTLDKLDLTRAAVLVSAVDDIAYGCVHRRFAVTATADELHWTAIDGAHGTLALGGRPGSIDAAVSRHDLVVWQYPGFASIHWLQLDRRGRVRGMGSAPLPVPGAVNDLRFARAGVCMLVSTRVSDAVYGYGVIETCITGREILHAPPARGGTPRVTRSRVDSGRCAGPTGRGKVIRRWADKVG